MNKYEEELTKFFSSNIAARHSNVFADFCAISAFVLSNQVDFLNAKAREESYMQTIEQYDYEEVIRLSEMIGMLIMAMEEYCEDGVYKDVLGGLYHRLNLYNKWSGQFFTPEHICNMMAKTSLADAREIVDINGHVLLMEPAVGSGAMLLACAQEIREQGLNPSKHIMAQAIDIDIRCCHMSYVQLSLYGIPAIINHGNSLTRENWSKWVTPLYVLGQWH